MVGDIGVLLSCHGTVEDLDDLAAFLRKIRHGRPAGAELVAEVRRRYEDIGGSPLMRISHAQAAALAERLGVPARAAGRLWDPYPAAVLQEMAQDGVKTVISLPLAPQSVHIYHRGVEDAAQALGLRVVPAPAWGLEPALVDAFAEAIEEARARLDPTVRDSAPIVLSAHSLPKRVIESGDPYEQDLLAMAEAVIVRLRARGIANPARVAFQSQGMDGGEWLGPSLETTFAKLAADGADALLIAPIGFVAEHVETLYDIDVAAAALAQRLGITQLERMPAMDTRRRFVDALEAVARPLMPH